MTTRLLTYERTRYLPQERKEKERGRSDKSSLLPGLFDSHFVSYMILKRMATFWEREDRRYLEYIDYCLEQ